MAALLRFFLISSFLSLQVTFVWATGTGTAIVLPSPSLSDTRSQPLFLSFEQRVYFSYALLAQGASEEKKNEVLSRINAYKNRNIEKGQQDILVNNFTQFLELYRGEWPNTNSLELDMKIIESRPAHGMVRYISKSSRIQRKIDEFLKTTHQEMSNLVQKNNAGLATKLPDLKTALRLGSFIANGKSDLQSDEESMKSAKALLDVSDQILTSQMQELDRVGTKISQMDMGGGSDVGSKILLQTIFGEYFSRLSNESKKLIVSAYLGGDLQASDLQKFEVMVQNSGPQLQKLLQVVARQADIDPNMLAIFKKLESSVKAVPWVQVSEILNNEKQNYEFLYFERKPLGIGTMAQVHRAKILMNGERKDVVVRFIKPGIEKRVQEDHRILVQVADILDKNPEFRKSGMPQLGPMVDDITKTVSAELSQTDTISRQRIAEKAYDREMPLRTASYKGSVRFHVPEIYSAKQGASAFMVQEMVLGRKLDKEIAEWQSLIPDLKQALVENVARLWLQEILFGSGFYHSDLHQGNFMVRVMEPAIQVSILDFGMGGVLSKDLQARVLVLGAGVNMIDERLIAESLWAISDKSKNAIDEKYFLVKVAEKAGRIRQKQDVKMDMDAWTTWATDQGLRLPYDFVNLNRGLVIVTKLLQDAGSPETTTTLTEGLAIKNPLRTWQALSEVGKMSAYEIVKLGWSQGSTPPKETKTSLQAPRQVLRCEAVFR